MAIKNLWLAMSQQALDEFLLMRSDPSGYAGPMDDETFRILSKAAHLDVVQRLYRTVEVGGKTYSLFSLYVEGTTAVQQAIDYITTAWPGHLIAVGAWNMNGTQVGTQYTYDDDGIITGVTGTPVYPIHAQAYRFISDAATSNADLKDINLLQGQSPRIFA